MRTFITGDKVLFTSPPGVYFPEGSGWIAKTNPANRNEYGIYIPGYGVREWYPSSCILLIERKGRTDVALPEMAHVKLKLSGSAVKIEMFHWMMSNLDPDWPWTPENHWSPEDHCKICGGAIYINPNLSAVDIRALVKQVDDSGRAPGGLKVKIKRFNVKARCSKDDPDLEPDDPPAAEEPNTPPVVVVTAEGE